MNLAVVINKTHVKLLLPILNQEIEDPNSPVVEVRADDLVDMEETSIEITFEEPEQSLSLISVIRMIQSLKDLWKEHRRE